MFLTIAFTAGLLAPPAGNGLSRRGALRELGALGLASLAQRASAYDSIGTMEPDFAALEQRRKQREAEEAVNRARTKTYVDKIARATDPVAYSDACDEFALWLIGQGQLPAGVDPKGIRDTIIDTCAPLTYHTPVAFDPHPCLTAALSMPLTVPQTTRCPRRATRARRRATTTGSATPRVRPPTARTLRLSRSSANMRRRRAREGRATPTESPLPIRPPSD